MSILIPGTTHQLRWTKQNLLDGTTYYVRAIIRDTRTGDALDTIDLDEVASGRFSTAWNVPGDPTGQGREIEVELTVYEDAAYTQVSGIYGRWTEEYLIYDLRRAGNSGGTGGGGNAALTYKETKALFELVLESALKPLKGNEADETEAVASLFEMKKTLESIKEIVSADDEEEPRELERLSEIARSMTEVVASLERVSSMVEKAETTLSKTSAELPRQVSQAVKEGAESINRESLKEFKLGISSQIDSELKYIVEKFKTIMQAEAKSISDSLGTGMKSLRKDLKKPLRLHAMRVMGDDEEEEDRESPAQKKPVLDPRVSRLLGIGRSDQ